MFTYDPPTTTTGVNTNNNNPIINNTVTLYETYIYEEEDFRADTVNLCLLTPQLLETNPEKFTTHLATSLEGYQGTVTNTENESVAIYLVKGKTTWKEISELMVVTGLDFDYLADSQIIKDIVKVDTEEDYYLLNAGQIYTLLGVYNTGSDDNSEFDQTIIEENGLSATAYRFKFNISSRCNNELASFYSDIWEFPSDAITDIVETETKLYDTSNLSGDHMTTDYNQFDVMITIPNDACKYVVDTDALGDYDIENSVTRIEEITFNFTYMDANDAMTSEVGIYYEEEEEDLSLIHI